MRRAIPLLLLATLAAPAPAAANDQSQASAKRSDVPAYGDLQTARVKHKGSSLVHEIRTFGAFKPRQLTTDYGLNEGLAFYVHLATVEPPWYLIGASRYVLQATWAGGSKVRGVLHDNETGRDRVVTATHPNSRTIRWTIPRKPLGKVYWWAAEISLSDVDAPNDFTPWLRHPLG